MVVMWSQATTPCFSRPLGPSGLLDEFPELAAYVARGEARPAYERAFAAQWAINAADPQAG
jgi:glutathione S-transferase